MKKLPKEILDGFIKVNKEKDLRVRQIHVYLKGHKPIYHEFMESRPENLYSGSKTYTSIAIGMLVDKGQLSLDDHLIDFFPEFSSIPDDITKKITVKHLLQMNSGKKGDMFYKHTLRTYKDYAQIFFEEGVQHEPGTKFYYNNLNSYMLSRIVEKLSGEKLRDYLEDRLFKKLGYFNTQWHTCPNGHTIGYSGLFLRTDEFAEVGKLLLQKGLWKGERLLSESYIEKMTTDLVSTADRIDKEEETDIEEEQGYGYHIWNGSYKDSFRADGLYGQFCSVYPNEKCVVTITARQEWRPYEIIKTVNEEITKEISNASEIVI